MDENATTNPEDMLIVLCTCPIADGDSESVAKTLARGLIEKKLAACVNIMPPMSSIYSWQGEIHEDNEQLLIIKTTRTRYPQLEVELRQAHPYELPEIIAVPLSQGLPEYLSWVTESVS